MSPELKFHSYVIGFSTLIIFSLWALISELTDHIFFAVITASLISLGAYRVCFKLFLKLFRKIKFIRKYILGSTYMEGTWCGFFIGHKGDVQLIVERFEQDLGTLYVKGEVYKEDGTVHGSYESDLVTIDSIKGKITYTYSSDNLGNSHNNTGFVSFSMIRCAKTEPALELRGYSSDLFSSKKLIAFEQKLDDQLLVDDSIAIEKAKSVFEKHKSNI